MQLALFDPYHLEPATPPAPHTRPTTSRTAAEQIQPAAATLRRAVLRFIQSQGSDGATDAEIQTALDLTGDTQRPRRWELQRAGLIVDSGRRRKTPAARDAIVWTATGRN